MIERLLEKTLWKTNDMPYISRVKELREKADITQRNLSFEVGVTENTIQNWEKKDYKKDTAFVIQIRRLITLCQQLKLECEGLKNLIQEVPEKNN